MPNASKLINKKYSWIFIKTVTFDLWESETLKYHNWESNTKRVQLQITNDNIYSQPMIQKSNFFTLTIKWKWMLILGGY